MKLKLQSSQPTLSYRVGATLRNCHLWIVPRSTFTPKLETFLYKIHTLCQNIFVALHIDHRN
jgi:hypothetical protein